MKGTTLRLLRATSVVWVLAIGAAVVMSPPVVNTVEAKRRKKRKKKKKKPQSTRTIKKEGDLAPKKEYGLDDDITKTKDLKPIDEEEGGPGLSALELERVETESMLDDKLDEEIGLAQQLLEFEQECAGGAPVRFRLADLFWEKSKRAFFKSEDFNASAAERKRYARQRKKLESSSLQHYERILDRCPDYEGYAKVLFYMGKALVETERARDGATYFKRVIKEYPESEWLPFAWFWVGHYYFNDANDAHKALKAYRRAGEDRTSPIYGMSVYQQGWCHINTGDWDLAIERFTTVISISEDPKQPLDKRGRFALRKQAVKDYVRAYSNLNDAKHAVRDFIKVGGKKSLQSMLERLGKWYINRDDHANVITVHTDLIKNYNKSTRVPIFQGRIVEATSRVGNKKRTVQEAKLLTDYFQNVRSRRDAGKLSKAETETIAKDLREAEHIAENTLRRLALEYHKEAKKLRGSAEAKTYQRAHDLYKHYLAVFPEPKADADVNYVFFMRFYFAEVLFKLEEFLAAARNYDMVVDMNPHPKKKRERDIVFGAAEEAVRSYDELVQDLDRKDPPEISGTDAKPIPDIKNDLIRACRRYIEYAGSAGEKIVEIRFKMARIFYTYNHFDEAAPAFDDIVANHPESEVACYAANLTLDIYNGAKNFKALRGASKSYLANDRLSCGDKDRTKFAGIVEKSSYNLVKSEYEDKKRYLAAANAYLRFYKEFPKSDLADDAVYNAAVNYDLGNRLDKANEVRKFLVEKIPDSTLVPETLYNIGQSYERIVDFDNAAHYLEMYVKRYPDDDKSKDALFNAGTYRAMLRDYDAAKSNRDTYVRRYPGEKDVAEVAFSVCQMLEDKAEYLERLAKRGKAPQKSIYPAWVAAHDCYFGYVKNTAWVRADPDSLCHAQFRRGEVMRTKTNYPKGVADQQRYLFKNWAGWKKRHGLKELPRCAAGVAELKFRELRSPLKRYMEMRINELNPTKKGKKKFDASVRATIKARDELVRSYTKVVEFGVAEWSLAALYRIGQVYRESIDKLLKAPIPKKVQGFKLGAEEKEMLRGELRKLAAPIEGSAVEAFKVCVDKANELGVYNNWSVKALDELQKLRPEAYPLVVEVVPELKFDRKTEVARNGVYLLDGEQLKRATVKLVAGAPPPGGAASGNKKNKKNKKREAVAPAKGKSEATAASKGNKSRKRKRGRKKGRGR